jgi:glutathionyl-hydroquinone reductase
MVSIEGEFLREDAVFRRWIGQEGLEPEAGRYHLYAALACPWSHRAVIVRKLKGLEDAIGISYLHPFRDERGWAFPGGRFVDDINGFDFLAEAYEATDPHYGEHVSVPVLWDKRTGTIVNNESAEIIRMLGSAFDELAEHPELDLYPEPLRAEIDTVNDWVYSEFNNGVYRAGFSKSQRAYDAAFERVFDALARIEGLLGERRYLAGDVITEADWRLFTTLLRFDPVYVGHFKCNLRRIADYPNLSNYLRELYQWPGIAGTVNMDHIKRHYYMSMLHINPNGIVPLGPALDFEAPHDRARFR